MGEIKMEAGATTCNLQAHIYKSGVRELQLEEPAGETPSCQHFYSL
jgi:hypothetical protein